MVERYAALVYGSALRRLGRVEAAAVVTQSVFLALARRARRLGKRTVLAGWLFRVTSVACRKSRGRFDPTRWWHGLWGRSRRPAAFPGNSPPPLDQQWAALASELDAGIDRLPTRLRDAVLPTTVLGLDPQTAARQLGVDGVRLHRRALRGLRKLARLLQRRGVGTNAEEIAGVLKTGLEATPLPADLIPEVLAALEQSRGKTPAHELARRTLVSLAWKRWWRRLAIAVPGFILLLLTAGGVVWYLDSLTGHSRLISTFLVWSVKNEARTVPGLAQVARPWPAESTAARTDAATLRTANDLYQTTNIWPVHLKFTRNEWKAAQPRRIGALPHFLQPDGTVLLRHPEAQRSGLAGVLGFDFDWTRAELEFGGVEFTNVAARIKGNGTYLGSLHGVKRSFKVDLNKLVDGRKLAGIDELTFNNLINDYSCLSDALAYEFFREAGLPAPRTAYAYLSLSVEGLWERRALGLYAMVEAVDADFAQEHFGTRRTPIFKPVTYDLFHHLGDDWAAYAATYDLKTKATPEQLQRVIEFSRLLTHAGEDEFAARAGEFLDLERFARHLACEVLLSNYDSFLSNGQNFYLYLDPRSNKFGFIPWDLDLSWGGFFLLGTPREREQASIWQPWVGRHRLLERLMRVGEFRRLYRAALEDLLVRLFVPDRLHKRIDTLAQVVRDAVAAESDFRLRKFDQAVNDRPPVLQPGEGGQGANRPAHQLKRFIARRAISVREQLDGKSEGVVLKRGRTDQ